MKLIELGADKVARMEMLRVVAYEGAAPATEAENRRLSKLQARIDELVEDPPDSLVLDDEDVALLAGRVFGAGIQWAAKYSARCLDVLDVLKAANEWKPEAEKKPMSVELSRDDAA